MIELLMGMSMFGVMLMGLSGSVVKSELARRAAWEHGKALEALQNEVSRLKSQGLAATVLEAA